MYVCMYVGGKCCGEIPSLFKCAGRRRGEEGKRGEGRGEEGKGGEGGASGNGETNDTVMGRFWKSPTSAAAISY